MTARSADFENTVVHLAFSLDGTRLAATLMHGGGLHLLRAADLSELARDSDCGVHSYGADFDRGGRLVTTCYDGYLRLYDAEGRRVAKRKVEGGNEPFWRASHQTGSGSPWASRIPAQ